MAKYTAGELIYLITGDNSKFKKSLDNSEKDAKKFGGKVGGVFKTLRNLAIGIGIAKIGKELISAASDAEETRNKFNVVFRDISKRSSKVAKDLSKNYGLSSKSAQQLLSDTGDLLTGFGFTQQSALDLSTQVNKLAVDLASFTNYSGGAQGASAALTKALLGERESIKQLGIAITEADIKRLAEEKGIVGELDRQTKASLTLALAIEQSKNAIGDFQRSEESFANQTRIAQARLEDLAVKLGERLLPVANKVVGLIIDLTDVLFENEEAFEAIDIIIAKLSDGIKFLSPILEFTLNSFSTLVIGINRLVTGEEKYISATKDLAKAQKKLNEINETLTSSTEDLTEAERQELKVRQEQLEIAAKTEIRKIAEDYLRIQNEINESLERQNELPAAALEQASSLLSMSLNYNKKKEIQATIQQQLQEGIDEELNLQEKLVGKNKELVELLGAKVALEQVDLDMIAAMEPRLALLVGLEAERIKKAQVLAEEKVELNKLSIQENEGNQIAFDNEVGRRNKLAEKYTEYAENHQNMSQGMWDRISVTREEAHKAELKRIEIEKNKKLDQLKSFAKQTGDVYNVVTDIADRYFESQLQLYDKDSEKYKEVKRQQFEYNKAVSAINAAIAGAQAAVGAYQALSGIPVVGPALGATAAAVITAFTTSQVGFILSQQFPGFQDGGFVPGNQFRGDNIPIRTNSGEAVLNPEQQRQFMDIANGNTQGAGGIATLKIVLMSADEQTEHTVNLINNRDYLIDTRSIQEGVV